METVRPSGQHFSIDIALAAAYGVNEAFLIHHFQHWIRINRDRSANFKEGRTWSYQTYQQIADHFPFLNYDKVKYAIENLEKHGVLLKGNFNKSPFDTTNWYAFVEEEVFVPCIYGKSKNVYERENSPSIGKIPSSGGNFPSSIPDTQTSDALPVVVVAGARGQAAGSDIAYTNCKGENKTISESEVYRHFVAKPEFNEVLSQALQLTREGASGVNNILKYIEGICKNIITAKKAKLVTIDKELPKSEVVKEKTMLMGDHPMFKEIMDARRRGEI